MEPKMDRINVSLRIRPFPSQDNATSSSLQTISRDPPILLVLDRTRSQTYHFDNIFSEDIDQMQVYNDAVKPFVEYVKQGYNCTVFTYGQTGTGKTYTMGSGPQMNEEHHIGIIPRALEQLFNESLLSNEEEIEVFISFLEIYNEKVFDLLQPGKKTPLAVSGFVVQGLSRKLVGNIKEANELLELGNKNRHVGETKQNVNSSRSHAIFTVYFTLKNRYQEVSGKLNLVDLAGSESVKKTASKGNTFQEGVNINMGLLSVGCVITALSTKSTHIPYRQSMITSILQGSLNMDNFISLIACVSGNPEDITETLQTLEFARRTKKVRSNPEVNEAITKYKNENPSFFRTPMKRPNSTPLKTPAFKKVALSVLPLIDESTRSQVSTVDNSESQFSINSSTVSCGMVPTITQQMLSPVLRKYVNRMEESIMDRVETVIRTTLRQPRRKSSTEKLRAGSEKENTPMLHWSQVRNEVSKMVQHEIVQMTVKNVKMVGATSSPIENEGKLTARRLLKYDSPVPESAKLICEREEEAMSTPSKMSLSPIETPKPTPRRSVRLSLKHANTSDLNNTLKTLSFYSNSARTESASPEEQTQKDTLFKVPQLPFRKNKRAPSDRPGKSTSVSLNQANITLNVSDRSFDAATQICDESSNKSVLDKSRIQTERRKSVRLAKKQNVSDCYHSPSWIGNKKKTPSKVLVERTLKKTIGKDSPYTAHSKRVLNILNQGSQKEVEKLHTIGSKTAEQILLFRSFKGNLNEIGDLSKLPGWGMRRYEKFVALNFLKKD